jgi:SAM-dependent methyltransferase
VNRLEPDSKSEFDRYAGSYEEALQSGLRVSGEDSDYFAKGRMEWLRYRIGCRNPSEELKSGMDFGCGTGNSICHLSNILGLTNIVGLDTSEESLHQARRRYSQSNFSFANPFAFRPSGDLDIVFCNGVFHHIPIEARPKAFEVIHSSLRQGGWFAFWENNPWNPGTRYVMSRIPFDRDAITLSIPNAKQLIVDNKFRVLSIDTRFYFPRAVKWMRPFERWLCKLPFGAQYLVLAQKPKEPSP